MNLGRKEGVGEGTSACRNVSRQHYNDGWNRRCSRYYSVRYYVILLLTSITTSAPGWGGSGAGRERAIHGTCDGKRRDGTG